MAGSELFRNQLEKTTVRGKRRNTEA